MAKTRRKLDADFREGAVRLVRETGKAIAQVAPRISAVLAWQPGGPWPRLLAVLAATP